MHPIRTATIATALATALAAGAAHASLVHTLERETSGTGLGAVNTVLTIQADGAESGCVAWNGSTDVIGPAACPTGFAGGDETSITQTRTPAELGIASAFNLRLVFNFNEVQADPGTDNIRVENLVLRIFDSTSGAVCFDSGPFQPDVFLEPAPGTGNAGFVYRLDAAQAAQAEPCFADPQNRIGLAARAELASDGPETFFVADAASVTPAEADLAILKTDSPDPVAVSSALSYTLTVTNNGPNNAPNTTVIDTLPPSVTFVSATPDQGSCSHSGGMVNCDLGTVLAGDSVDITIAVTTGSDARTITNTASVTASVSDPDPNNNTAVEQTTVGLPPPASANLSIIKNDAPDPVQVGNTLTYSLLIANAGPDTATAAVVTDTLPASFGSIAASSPGNTCNVSGQTVSCQMGDIGSGMSETVTITTVPSVEGTFTNTATVGADTADPDTGDNQDSEQTTVVAQPAPSADLAIAKTDDPDPVAVGGTLTYELTVTNNGPDGATDVVVTDQVPASLSAISASSTGNSCSVSGQTVTCQMGNIASGAMETITITATTTTDGTVTNTATVDSATPDPDSANNTATEQTTVGLGGADSADVSVVKNDSPDPVAVGGTVTYTVTVRNRGPDTATAVVATDTVPASFANIAASSAGNTCSVSGRVVTCQMGDLASGAIETITITAEPTLAGTFTNTVSVAADTTDPNPANNADTEQTDVVTGGAPSLDVAIAKSDSMDPVTVGASFSYLLQVSNLGSFTATNVNVSDSVPAAFGIDAVTVAGGGSCTVTGQLVQCDLGSIAPGASKQVTIDVTATSAGTFTNAASVGADQPDPDTSNNAATETTTVTTVGGPGPGAERVIPALDLRTLLLLALAVGMLAALTLRRTG